MVRLDFAIRPTKREKVDNLIFILYPHHFHTEIQL